MPSRTPNPNPDPAAAAAHLAQASRLDQGLSPTITDPVVIDRLAALIARRAVQP